MSYFSESADDCVERQRCRLRLGFHTSSQCLAHAFSWQEQTRRVALLNCRYLEKHLYVGYSISKEDTEVARIAIGGIDLSHSSRCGG